MKFGLCLGVVLFASTAFAGSVSYVVLQNLDEDSLVRVSADGKHATTIANGAAGVGLTVDRGGNYIVAARSALLRVTRAGVVTTIATAPNGSEWVAVAEHAGGGLVVADGILHVIWRVSDDGRTVDKFAEYPGSLPRGGSGIGLLRDDSGDFLLLGLGDDNTAHLYLISPAGVVSHRLANRRPAAPACRAAAGGTSGPASD